MFYKLKSHRDFESEGLWSLSTEHSISQHHFPRVIWGRFFLNSLKTRVSEAERFCKTSTELYSGFRLAVLLVGNVTQGSHSSLQVSLSSNEKWG